MNTFFRYFGALSLVCLGFASVTEAVPAKKPPIKKPTPKPTKKPQLGVKETPQMNGAVGRFGDLYALKSGFTFQLVGARYSYAAFDDYSQLYPETGKKLLVMRVAIKNNSTNQDQFFNPEEHQFQLQASNGELYTGGAYRLASEKAKSFGPSLKPGQGLGQDAGSVLEVAVPIAEDAKITKIVLQQGRKGSSESVMRFFVAGTEGGDPKNVVSAASPDSSAIPITTAGLYPSSYYQFRINSVQFVPGPIAGNEAPENRRFAIVNLTVKNATSKQQSVFDFLGDSIEKVVFTDADGETYPASGDIGILKGSSEEKADGYIEPEAEKTWRVVVPVPKTTALKTLTVGATNGKYWTFDASNWK